MLAGEGFEASLEDAARTVALTLGVECAKVLELRDDGRLLLRVGAGSVGRTLGSCYVAAGRGSLAGYTLLAREPVVVEDLAAETRCQVRTLLPEQDLVSAATVIIHDQLRPYGVLEACSTQRRLFSSAEVEFLQAVANLLSVANQRRRSDAEQDNLLEELRAVVVGRDKAMSIVNHDLRSPLSTILICASALLDSEPPSVEGARHMGQLIQRSANWMNQLIQDLADRVSLDTNRLVLERRPTAVLGVLNEARKVFSPIVADRSLTLRVDCRLETAVVDADPRRLLQVLVKLLDNAVQFTPEGGAITLAARADDGSGTRSVRFTVSDTGLEIPESELPHIGDWFTRSYGRGHGSAGLALAIARGLVEAHGARLHVASNYGRGTSFWFTLPVLGTRTPSVRAIK